MNMENNQNTSAATSAESEKSAQENVNKVENNANAQNSNDRQSGEQSIADTAKETANKAVGQAKEKAVGLLDDQKSKAVTGLSSVADSIRKVGAGLRISADQNALTQTTARYGDNLAEKIESLSGYLEDATLKDLSRDIERFARRQPALFVGGAFLVGVLAARFLKTSAPRQNSANSRNR